MERRPASRLGIKALGLLKRPVGLLTFHLRRSFVTHQGVYLLRIQMLARLDTLEVGRGGWLAGGWPLLGGDVLGGAV